MESHSNSRCHLNRYIHCSGEEDSAYLINNIIMSHSTFVNLIKLIDILNDKLDSPVTCADFKSARNVRANSKGLRESGCEVCSSGEKGGLREEKEVK